MLLLALYMVKLSTVAEYFLKLRKTRDATPLVMIGIIVVLYVVVRIKVAWDGMQVTFGANWGLMCYQSRLNQGEAIRLAHLEKVIIKRMSLMFRKRKSFSGSVMLPDAVPIAPGELTVKASLDLVESLANSY